MAPALVVRGDHGDVNGYPIQPAKVQRPPLRDETLARDRLLDWLQVKIHHRIVFVVAEAGYGKTTLLADFSRRTRLRTLWYRLDDEDRNWVAFLNYLVAAGREYDPGFAETAARLLRDLESTNESRESVTRTFVRDFQALGQQGAVVILDDYHAVDDAPDVAYVVGELLAHAPERVTFVFSSRREPAVRVARLRALGELAELSTDDLRFNEPETERLFRETYGHPLEPDVLDDLSRRTEGWAASLQLVQAAIRDRSAGEVRRFVRTLSGAEGNLYDYLAEEVVGELTEDLQDFLMKTSLLQTVDHASAGFATGLDDGTTRRLLADAERVGLLSIRGGRTRGSRGYHPLVRQFLEHRFKREAGPDAVTAVHLNVAQLSEEIDWASACFHYAAAASASDVRRVVRAALPEIMGGGQFGAAAAYLDEWALDREEPAFEVIRSRAEFRAGRTTLAVERAERALESDPGSELAATNALSLRLFAGDVESADKLAVRLARTSSNPLLRSIAEATAAMVRLAIDGNLSRFVAQVLGMAKQQHDLGLRHYEGVSLANAASALKAQGLADECLHFATRSIELLTVTSDGHEVLAGRLSRAWALAHLGRWAGAVSEMNALRQVRANATRVEALVEMAAIHLWYGDRADAEELLDEAEPHLSLRPDMLDPWKATAVEARLQAGNLGMAKDIAADLKRGVLHLEPGLTVHALATEAYLALTEVRPNAKSLAEAAADLAARQDATFWTRYCRVLVAAASDHVEYARRMRHAVEEDAAYLSILAELIVARLPDTDPALLDLIEAEANLRQARWLRPLREAVDDVGSPARWHAARLLDHIGEHDDVARLRTLARTPHARAVDRPLGKSLARRLAPRIFVDDQGPVAIRIGSRTAQGTEVRRKVLALLCFLLSRKGFAATRDQVLDALWPDVEPPVALNSLNQTVYFLRRVFEPDYQEDVSPGYLRHDSNVISLDEDLVATRSAECWELISRAGVTRSPDDIVALADRYLGKFALDFAYEEWAFDYRDSLHAAYLQVIEHAVSADTNSAQYDRAMTLARRALEVDPEAEELEKALLRLYRLSGAHSAAAEQYGHYAAVLRRDLDLDPPALDTV